jgi:uncharacterized protein YggT (Ycf19 family)
MGIVDFILNLAGLLLWLNWRSIRFDPLVKRTPATLMGTLRPAEPKKFRRWHWLAVIAGLLAARALIYWQIGASMSPVWSGKLDLGTVVLSIPCHGNWAGLGRMLLFSFLSFGLMLGIFYAWLLLLSLLAGPEPFHRLVRIPLGRVDAWPRWTKLLLPLVVTATAWCALSWLLGWLQIFPPPVSMGHRLEQSLVIALGGYLVWKFPAGALLVLHLLSSYIYFGKHPFWKYVNATAQTLLQPLRKIPLQLGRVDFAPVLAVAMLFFAAEGAGRGLAWLYARLPL